MDDKRCTQEVTCDICKCPYVAPLYDNLNFVPKVLLYDGDLVYIRKQVAGGTKTFDGHICPFCSSDILKYVESLIEKHERYKNERKM